MHTTTPNRLTVPPTVLSAPFPKQLNPLQSSSSSALTMDMDRVAVATYEFLSSAQEGKLKRLKKYAAVLDELLGYGIPSIFENCKDGECKGAIHYAATGGSVEVLKYLIDEMKIEIDVKAAYGETPLCYAAAGGHLAAVQCLLEMGVNPEIPDYQNTSPLHLVARKGYTDIIPLLLSKGISVDVTDDFGAPLHHAASAGQHDAVKVLLDHGANPNLVFHDTFTPLQASIRSQSWQCAEQLLKAGADPNGGPDGVKALPLAAEVGAKQFIKDLVEAGANAYIANMVRWATQIIKLLVEAAADPNVTNLQGLKPIEVAAVNDNRRGVEILFPVTSPIPSYVDWSVDGIMKHVNSKKFEKKMTRKVKASFLEAKSRGTSAFHKEEYWLAVYWYSQALLFDPDDASVLSNRSLCYVYLNKGDLALEDSTQCVLARPDWPKAFYREGVALKLLNRLDDAADAFFKGLKVDPKNKELQDAFREVTLDKLKAVNVPL